MENTNTPSDFKPNMYPIMYWALAFGATAGILLFVLSILSRFITVLWFPVFLIGLIWGGYRNYQKQKLAWQAGSGAAVAPSTPLNEFKQAVRDISDASRDLMAEQPVETEVPAADTTVAPDTQYTQTPDEPQQPQPPVAPPV